MISQDKMNKLFNITTEVGVATAIDLLQNLRGKVQSHKGNFIDGFDYAINALQKTDEVIKTRDDTGSDFDENHWQEVTDKTERNNG